jgi:hypothetical protein
MPVISAASVGWGTLAVHTVAITMLANLGKMFPVFCYRSEADWRERLALCIGMWPRGEVGAGVLVISLGYGIGGVTVAVATLCLALNLLCTGLFIYFVSVLRARQWRPRLRVAPASVPVARASAPSCGNTPPGASHRQGGPCSRSRRHRDGWRFNRAARAGSETPASTADPDPRR